MIEDGVDLYGLAFSILECPTRELTSCIARLAPDAVRVVKPPPYDVDATVIDRYGPDVEVTPPPVLEIIGSDPATVETGRWIDGALQQRARTLRRLVAALCGRLEGALIDGNDPLPPVSSFELASDLRVHVSTIRKVVGRARIATPRGELALSDLVNNEAAIETTTIARFERLAVIRAADGRLFVLEGATSAVGDHFSIDGEPGSIALRDVFAGAFRVY
jgi:hypothetical protein